MSPHLNYRYECASSATHVRISVMSQERVINVSLWRSPGMIPSPKYYITFEDEKGLRRELSVRCYDYRPAGGR